jgi:hypothetical protein
VGEDKSDSRYAVWGEAMKRREAVLALERRI